MINPIVEERKSIDQVVDPGGQRLERGIGLLAPHNGDLPVENRALFDGDSSVFDGYSTFI